MFRLKLALRPWRRAWLSQLVSTVAVAILLGLSGFLFWFQGALKPVLQRLRNEQVVSVYVKPDLESAQAQGLVDSIRATVGSAAIREADVAWVGTEEFLNRIETQDSDLYRELKSMGEEALPLIPRYVSIAGVLPESFLSDLKRMPGVEQVETSRDRNRPAIGAFSTLRWLSRLLLAGIWLALAVGLLHLARTNSYLQRDAIEILRAWGASEWSVRLPSILSGLAIGLTGGLLALGGWWILSQRVIVQIQALSPFLRELSSPQPIFAFLFLCVGVVLGALSGWVGSASLSR